MGGFPDWKRRGAVPAPGTLGEWHFTVPAEGNGPADELSRILATIRLLPEKRLKTAQWLLTWERWDVELIHSVDYHDEATSTSALLEGLKAGVAIAAMPSGP